MFNLFSTKTKSGKRITVQVSAPQDTGRISPRNRVVAHQEGKRQQALYKRGATGS